MDNLQQPSVLAMPFANNGDKNVIPSAPTGTNKASLSEGFPQVTSESIAEGGIPPERADFNALGNIATMFYYFMQCGGAYTFRADVSSTIGGYPKGALLWYIPATGIPNLLASTINNNTNNFNTDQSVIGEAGSGKPWEIVTVSPTNFMDLISNQTAAGEKTFTGEIIRQFYSLAYAGIKVKNTSIMKGTTPSTDTGGQFTFQDSSTGTAASSRIGGVEAIYKSNGDIITRLEAYKPTANSIEYTSIDLVYKADGTKYATAPTPVAGDSSNKIATTEFVKDAIINWGKPDYANKIATAANTSTYTTLADGWVQIMAHTRNVQTATFSIGSTQVWKSYSAGDRSADTIQTSGLFFVKSGTVCTASYPSYQNDNIIYFYPMI